MNPLQADSTRLATLLSNNAWPSRKTLILLRTVLESLTVSRALSAYLTYTKRIGTAIPAQLSRHPTSHHHHHHHHSPPLPAPYTEPMPVSSLLGIYRSYSHSHSYPHTHTHSLWDQGCDTTHISLQPTFVAATLSAKTRSSLRAHIVVLQHSLPYRVESCRAHHHCVSSELGYRHL
ncbi:hypothetical protein LY78DRAFT_52492 [Colletotrichum sublineola]|nr:hypothetical protein LY78DRAFT_52492 [Colletotrichum sublineola]